MIEFIEVLDSTTYGPTGVRHAREPARRLG